MNLPGMLLGVLLAGAGVAGLVASAQLSPGSALGFKRFETAGSLPGFVEGDDDFAAAHQTDFQSLGQRALSFLLLMGLITAVAALLAGIAWLVGNVIVNQLITLEQSPAP